MASPQTTTKNGKGKEIKPAPVGTKQTEIPGAERPKLPAEVEKAAASLRSQFLKRHREQLKEDKLRADLLSVMERHQVARVELVDDEDDTIEILLDPGKPKIKMRKLDKDEN